MALTKHMTAGDLTRIRRMMADGITSVAKIQEEVRIHPSRIEEALKGGLPKGTPVKKQTAKQKAQAAAAAKVDPVS